MTFDFSIPVPCNTVLKASGDWTLVGGEVERPCHAVVLWMEYQLLQDHSELVVSEGLVQVCAVRVAFMLA